MKPIHLFSRDRRRPGSPSDGTAPSFWSEASAQAFENKVDLNAKTRAEAIGALRAILEVRRGLVVSMRAHRTRSGDVRQESQGNG